ncbi:MAG: hypothetical protein Q4C16_09270 [Eubacteriales bacterium]|nr:hypothetical protein [Eubacteriales bacterium]
MSVPAAVIPVSAIVSASADDISVVSAVSVVSSLSAASAAFSVSSDTVVSVSPKAPVSACTASSSNVSRDVSDVSWGTGLSVSTGAGWSSEGLFVCCPQPEMVKSMKAIHVTMANAFMAENIFGAGNRFAVECFFIL